jgi:hypothetical protein
MKPLKYFLNTTGVIAFFITIFKAMSLDFDSTDFKKVVIICTLLTIYWVVAFVLNRMYFTD